MFARTCRSIRCAQLPRDGRNRCTGVHCRAWHAAGHGAAVGCVFPGDPLSPSCLRRQIWNERTRLDTPSGLSNRSIGTHGLSAPRCVSTRPCPRGTLHQSRAAACHLVNNMRSNRSQPRLFCSLAPKFSRNQPAVQISSKELHIGPDFIHFKPCVFQK